MKTIILASSSPRRTELFKKLQIPFQVIPSNINEDLTLSLPPQQLAEELSRKKAQTVAKKHKKAIIIGADTIVVLDNKIFGKPKSKKGAKKMLQQLSGRTHQVITAFTIIDTVSEKEITKSACAFVTFNNLTADKISQYIEKNEVLDKAGAYAIQDAKPVLVKSYQGDYETIVGLPIFELKKALKGIES